jgi:hypothetical protein
VLQYLNLRTTKHHVTQRKIPEHSSVITAKKARQHHAVITQYNSVREAVVPDKTINIFANSSSSEKILGSTEFKARFTLGW